VASSHRAGVTWGNICVGTFFIYFPSASFRPIPRLALAAGLLTVLKFFVCYS